MHFSTEYIAKRLLEQKISFVLFTIGLSFIIILLTYIFLEMQVISPIRKLMQASLDIASGKFTRLSYGNGKDEISKLTENFNYMVDKIEHSLNLIKGLSEASQEIVKCKSIDEVSNVYEGYAKRLINAQKVDIWLNTSNEASDNPTGVNRVSDGIGKLKSDPIFQKLLSTKEVIYEKQDEESVSAQRQYNVITVPLLNSKNNFVGIAEIFFDTNVLKFGEDEVQIIKSLSTPLVTAVENYWHVLKEKNRANLERDIELASAVQDSIISKNIPSSSYYSYSTFYKTASQCGGDWFGVYEVEKGKNTCFIWRRNRAWNSFRTYYCSNSWCCRYVTSIYNAW